MGALRHPQRPSPPFEDLDRPHLALTLPTPVPPPGRSFLTGVAAATIGALLMLAGAATASAATAWAAVVPLLLATLALRSSLRAGRFPAILGE